MESASEKANSRHTFLGNRRSLGPAQIGLPLSDRAAQARRDDDCCISWNRSAALGARDRCDGQVLSERALRRPVEMGVPSPPILSLRQVASSLRRDLGRCAHWQGVRSSDCGSRLPVLALGQKPRVGLDGS
jgi:hypothetical protein